MTIGIISIGAVLFHETKLLRRLDRLGPVLNPQFDENILQMPRNSVATYGKITGNLLIGLTTTKKP